MITTLVLLFLSQANTSCVLTEGVGADFAKLGITRQEKSTTPSNGITLEFENDVLVRIFVYGGDCRTSKGLKVGDSQEEVEKLYGKGKRTSIYLSKGSHDRLGKLGDFALEYPGVAFVMSKGRVAAMFIVACNSEKVKSP
jgi:hypothetical protein